MHGMTILREIKALHPDMVVIIMTGFGEIREAVDA